MNSYFWQSIEQHFAQVAVSNPHGQTSLYEGRLGDLARSYLTLLPICQSACDLSLVLDKCPITTPDRIGSYQSWHSHVLKRHLQSIGYPLKDSLTKKAKLGGRWFTSGALPACVSFISPRRQGEYLSTFASAARGYILCPDRIPRWL